MLARKHGLFVSSTTLPNRDASYDEKVTAGGKKKNSVRLCFVYEKYYRSDVDDPPCWQLIRYAKSIEPFDGWELKTDSLSGVRHIDSVYWQKIRDLVQVAPKRCFGVHCNDRNVGWMGLEDTSTGKPEPVVDSIDVWLTQLLMINKDFVKLKSSNPDLSKE